MKLIIKDTNNKVVKELVRENEIELKLEEYNFVQEKLKENNEKFHYRFSYEEAE